MKARQKRMVLVGLAIVGVGVAAVLALRALQGNISYFYSPSDIEAGKAPTDHVIRIGGLVTKGTLKRAENGLTVTFDVTDMAKTVKVSYTGILPDLFNEGRGAVARGHLGPDGVFYAEEVLAKHDEAYMPPEVASSLKTAHAMGAANPAGAGQGADLAQGPGAATATGAAPR
jgi:cytochrome c-type biogenesis protein CcmE